MPPRTSRMIHAKVIESSESDSESSSTTQSSHSSSTAKVKRMTKRQAALAGVAEAKELQTLDSPEPRKKKQFSEAEAALKKEENARKRKSMVDKRLEDEKAEVINRLLRRQSRPRGKKARLVDEDEQSEEGDESSINGDPTPVEVPTTIRWISSSRESNAAQSLSIPSSILPILEATTVIVPELLGAKQTPICDVVGCGQPRKYKLVKDPSRGGCGMDHLKALQFAL